MKKMIKDMDWWNKMVFPVRRVWVSVSARVKARKNGQSLSSLSLSVLVVCGNGLKGVVSFQI